MKGLFFLAAFIVGGCCDRHLRFAIECCDRCHHALVYCLACACAAFAVCLLWPFLGSLAGALSLIQPWQCKLYSVLSKFVTKPSALDNALILRGIRLLSDVDLLDLPKLCTLVDGLYPAFGLGVL